MTDHKASPNYLVYQVGCIERDEGYVTIIDLHTCKTAA